MLQYGSRERVQFFLGAARDKGRVLIRSRAMSNVTVAEWMERETVHTLANAWPHNVRKTGCLCLELQERAAKKKREMQSLMFNRMCISWQ